MSFTRFGSLPLELRQYIWHEALQEEADARLVFVHRPTMRVMPHTTTVSRVMNANRESREYAKAHFYDVTLDVWTLNLDYQLDTEVAEFEQWPPSKDFTGGHPALEVAMGVHGAHQKAHFMVHFLLLHLASKLEDQVSSQLRAPLPKRDGPMDSSRRGTIYVSSKHDRFALSKITLTTKAPWRYRKVDMCERAFLRNYLCRDLDRFSRERASFNPKASYQAGGDPDDDFWSRHMAGRLPGSVVRRIQRIVFLNQGHTEFVNDHACGQEIGFPVRDWKLGTFKGASEFATMIMHTIPSRLDVGNLGLIEWEKVRVGRTFADFTCMCSKLGGQSRE
ncbi:hypothetical protein PGQ11_008144 [Apiospora arundinis]|uniref:2EXR domain-containing protein n=1 Tax=Apiospora arundinis TaxID=335852 RepID=A0ABR2IEB3_9PEZI